MKVFLGELGSGAKATIVRTEGPAGIRNRLMEIGFLEGAQVEVLHEAPFGKDPIAVRVRGSVIALRRNEANHVEVTLKEPS